jgi:hypothetical protein
MSGKSGDRASRILAVPFDEGLGVGGRFFIIAGRSSANLILNMADIYAGEF